MMSGIALLSCLLVSVVTPVSTIQAHEVTVHNLPDACDREKVMRTAGRGADYEKHKADFQDPQELMFCGLYVEGEIVGKEVR